MAFLPNEVYQRCLTGGAVPGINMNKDQPQLTVLASCEDFPDLARPSRDAAQVVPSQV